MYGKKRIVISKRGDIVLAGGHTWHPIGKAWKVENALKGSFLNPANQWEHQLNPENSIPFENIQAAELKKIILTHYPNQK